MWKKFNKIRQICKMVACVRKTPDYFLLGIDYSDNSKDGKILQVCGCLKNCSNEDIDTVLILAQGLSSKNNNNQI